MKRFLGIIAFLAFLVVGGAIIWRLMAEPLMRMAFVPGDEFSVATIPPAPDYSKTAFWSAHPALKDNPAKWVPEGFRAAPLPGVAAFFVGPTAFISRSGWNADLSDAETNTRFDDFVEEQASVFNGVAEIWAPRYRQATYGAFLKAGSDADKALDVAYGDVEKAFAAFIAAQPADRPLILAAHSQGSHLLLRLLAGPAASVKDRLVVAYAVGWPMTAQAVSEKINLPICANQEQTACVMAWQSYAEDAEIPKALTALSKVVDVDGQPVGTRPMVCVNPLTGGPEGADVAKNAGTLINGALQAQQAGAKCDASGLLLLSPPPTHIGQLILPNGNFHAYDYPLFWANIRADVEARLSMYAETHQPTGAQ